MNPRQRINALLAHGATFPIGINDRRVAVLGKYHGHLVYEHADGRICRLAEIVLLTNTIGEQISKKGVSLATLSYLEEGPYMNKQGRTRWSRQRRVF